MMKALMTNPLSLQFNWIGNRGKNGFNGFKQLELSSSICGKFIETTVFVTII